MKVVASTVENEEESDEDKVYVLKSIADDLCQPQVGSGAKIMEIRDGNFRDFGRYNFQRRRPIMTLGGVYKYKMNISDNIFP